MRMFGRELTLKEIIGLVETHANPDDDLVHCAALELIAALRKAQRREKAAVDDLTYFAGAITTGEPCSRCSYNPNDMGCELDGSQFDDDGECHFTWRGTEEGEPHETV